MMFAAVHESGVGTLETWRPAGVEYAFAQNWSLGFEYDHLFMGNKDVNSATGFLIADHVKEDVDLFTAPELQVRRTGGRPLLAQSET